MFIYSFFWRGSLAVIGAMASLSIASLLWAAPATSEESSDESAQSVPTEEPAPKFPLKRISQEDEVWVDMKRKLVVVNGFVCLRKGQLEMFACPRGSKTHESVVAVNSRAQTVHAGLLAVGAVPGQPVRFDPEYTPAKGPRVDVLVLWTDEEGQRHQTKAQQWVRSTRTGEAMDTHWVFGGSGFWKDQTSGKQYYMAEDGDLICVSNFPTATLDLPVKSSDSADHLLFEAFTKNIPPLDTKVTLVLVPRIGDKAPTPDAVKDAAAPEAKAPKSDEAKPQTEKEE